MTSLLKTKTALDRRDRKLLHAIRVAAEELMANAVYGHSVGWEEMRKALDKASDEMGDVEDFEP